MASSSSSSSSSSSFSPDPFDIPPPQKYDVFLSFRGVDTRATFTSHLRAALLRKKIDTYIDNHSLERGDKIAPALLKAIQKSKLSIIIFSKNYASSTWCLDELAHILECKERYGQIVIPVFYDIAPSHVRKQRQSYAEAFAQLEQRFEDSKHKVFKWRNALTEAAELSGFDNQERTGTEADFVEEVAEHVLTKLNRTPASVTNSNLYGMEAQIEKVETLLCIGSPDVCTVGIRGKGGIGKTTLAGALFDRLSSKFEASCFLGNVREEYEKLGFVKLRNVLFRKILNDKYLTIDTPYVPTFVRERLRRTKVLLVLDDVNESSQLQLIARDHPFGPGSRIIITTRDKRILKRNVNDDKIYKVEYKFLGRIAMCVGGPAMAKSLESFFELQKNGPPMDKEGIRGLISFLHHH